MTMPIYSVSFRKQFDVFVKAPSREDLKKAIDDDLLREVERDWDTGEWEADVTNLKGAKADHALVDGQIVNILDTITCNHPKPDKYRGWCDDCLAKAGVE